MILPTESREHDPKGKMIEEATSIIPVTVVIPVKDDLTALGRCLQPLARIASVVVVDSGSKDGSAEIAQRWGAEVIQFRWNGGFPKKRNWILQNYQFRTKWVMFVDADELLTPSFICELGKAINSVNHVGYWVNYENYFQGRLLRFGVTQRKLTLFRVGSGYYERIEDPGWSDLDMEVHEHPILNGSVGSLRSRVRHEDHSSLQKFIERHNKYSTWEARRYLALSAGSQTIGVHRTLRQRVKYALLRSAWLSVLYFLYSYFIRGGILDGSAGFSYAIYKAVYFFDISQKIRELQRDSLLHPRQDAASKYVESDCQFAKDILARPVDRLEPNEGLSELSIGSPSPMSSSEISHTSSSSGL